MSAGTRSSAITATAPASSAIFACSALTTSMITPPLSISARPLLTLIVPISCIRTMLAVALLLAVAVFGVFLGLGHRHHVLALDLEREPLSVLEQDDDDRRVAPADQKVVVIDDGRLLVVAAGLCAR